MARFFFHVINGEFVQDTHGIDCVSIEDAKAQAVRITGDMLKDQGLQIWKTRKYDMFVCDENNNTRLKIAFSVEDLNDH